MQKHLKHPVFNIIANIAASKNLEAYVIGGFVRDVIINRPSHDIDIVVIGNGIEFAGNVAKAIGNEVNINIFKNFGTAMLKYSDLEIEFVGARKESYRRNSRKPIVEDGTLKDDQERRDFTINAIAMDGKKKIVDFYSEVIIHFRTIYFSPETNFIFCYRWLRDIYSHLYLEHSF